MRMFRITVSSLATDEKFVSLYDALPTPNELSDDVLKYRDKHWVPNFNAATARRLTGLSCLAMVAKAARDSGDVNYAGVKIGRMDLEVFTVYRPGLTHE